MKIVAIIIAFIFSTGLNAQTKLKFQSQNFIGVLGGEKDASFQIQTINGVQYRTWFSGIGTGLDFYFQRSVPLFLSVGKYFSSKTNSPYFSLDGGTNFVWDKSTASKYNWFRTDGDFSPSLYYGANAGYKIGLRKNKSSILMMLGYSAKRLKEKLASPCLTFPCPDLHESINYEFNRYSFKMGLTF